MKMFQHLVKDVMKIQHLNLSEVTNLQESIICRHRTPSNLSRAKQSCYALRDLYLRTNELMGLVL